MAERSLDVSLRIGGAVQSSVGSAFRQVKQQGQRTAKEIAAASREANRATRQQLRSQMLSVAAPAVALALPVRQAMQFESVMADVNKVVDFKPGGLQAMSQAILKMSTDDRIPLAAARLGDIVTVFGREGTEKNLLLPMAEDAAKVAVAFDIAGTVAASRLNRLRRVFGTTREGTMLIADAINVLDNKTAATAAEILNFTNRAAATGKAVGFSANQINAMGAAFITLGEAPEKAARSFNSVVVRLANADRQGSKFQDSLSELGLEANDLAAGFKDNANEALLGFLRAVNESENASGILFDLLGEGFSDEFLKLAQGVGEYEKALALVSDQTTYAGAVQKEYDIRSKTTANAMQIFRNQANRLAITVGSVLLPPLNTVMGVIGKGVGLVTALAERFPMLTQVVGVTAFAVIALRLATLAGRYASTLYSDAVIQMRSALLKLQPAAVRATLSLWRLNVAAKFTAFKTFATAAIPAVIAGLKALSVAALTTPIGWIAVGIAGAALLIWAYWKPLKALFTGLWHGLMMGLAPIGFALKEAFAPLSPIMGALKAAFVALFGPIDANATTLEKLTAYGVKVGQVLGTLISVVLWPLVMALRGLSYMVEAVFTVMNDPDALAVMKQTFTDMVSWIWTLPQQLFNAGKAMIRAVGDGIKAAPGYVLGAAVGVFGKLKNLLPGSDAKTGPLSQLTASGRGMMSAIGEGVRQGQGSLVQPLAAGLAGAGLLLGSPTPGLAGRGGGGAPISISVQVGDIHLSAPGADGQAMAQQIAEQIRVQIQQAGRQAAGTLRGALHDGDHAGLGSV